MFTSREAQNWHQNRVTTKILQTFNDQLEPLFVVEPLKTLFEQIGTHVECRDKMREKKRKEIGVRSKNTGTLRLIHFELKKLSPTTLIDYITGFG